MLAWRRNAQKKERPRGKQQPGPAHQMSADNQPRRAPLSAPKTPATFLPSVLQPNSAGKSLGLLALTCGSLQGRTQSCGVVRGRGEPVCSVHHQTLVKTQTKPLPSRPDLLSPLQQTLRAHMNFNNRAWKHGQTLDFKEKSGFFNLSFEKKNYKSHNF